MSVHVSVCMCVCVCTHASHCGDMYAGVPTLIAGPMSRPSGATSSGPAAKPKSESCDTQTRTHTRTHTHTQRQTDTHTHTHTRTRTRMKISTYACTSTCASLRRAGPSFQRGVLHTCSLFLHTCVCVCRTLSLSFTINTLSVLMSLCRMH